MADGSIPITAGSGTPVRALTNAGVQSGAYQQVVSLGGPDGQLYPTDPDGTVNVSAEATTLFTDDFSGTLASTWTTGGTAPTNSLGQSTFASSTTASAASYMRSIGAFPLRQASYLRPIFHVQIESAAIANSQRWWGIGFNQGSPTAAAPVLNGAVFELNYADGTLRAAIYSNGTRTQVAALARPTDGLLHRYELWYRQSRIDWVQDGAIVATRLFPNLAVANNLALIAGSINHTTAPSAAPVLVISSAGVADHSGTNRTISDGDQPWLAASVKAASTAAVATDKALVTAFHPSSPLPSGSAIVGSVGVQDSGTYIRIKGSGTAATSTDSSLVVQPSPNLYAQAASYAATSTASTNAAVIKASAGSLFELTLSNPTATAAFVKIYNKASAPTVGTDVPVLTQRLAASGSVGDTVALSFGTFGKRLSAGIAIAITAAAIATDTAATVANIQVHASYI